MFEALLICEFKGKPGERKIKGGRYLLMDNRFPEELIESSEWQQRVLPGSEIHMSVYLARLYDTSARCPRPGCLEGVTDKLDLRPSILRWLVRLPLKQPWC